jgi:predicted Ser/Thr protein kinase
MGVKMVKIYEKKDHEDWSGLRDVRRFRDTSPPEPRGPDIYTQEEHELFEVEKDHRHAHPGLQGVSRRYVGNVFTHTFHFDTETNAMDFMRYVRNTKQDVAIRQMVAEKLQSGEIPSYKVSVYLLLEDGTIRQLWNVMQGLDIVGPRSE